MTEDQENKIDELRDICHKIHEGQVQMKAVIFGVEGQDGLLRRVNALEEHKASTSAFMAKLTGIAVVLSGVASLIGSKLATLLKDK